MGTQARVCTITLDWLCPWWRIPAFDISCRVFLLFLRQSGLMWLLENNLAVPYNKISLYYISSFGLKSQCAEIAQYISSPSLLARFKPVWADRTWTCFSWALAAECFPPLIVILSLHGEWKIGQQWGQEKKVFEQRDRAEGISLSRMKFFHLLMSLEKFV